MTALLVAAGGFLVMELAGAMAHRFLLHGPWWPLHRSHHLRPSAPVQAGDLVPFVLALLWSGVLVAVLSWWPPLAWLAVGALVQVALHVLVHDLGIHRRFGLPRMPLLDPWARAHERHHRTLGPPYGVLLAVRRRRPVADAAAPAASA